MSYTTSKNKSPLRYIGGKTRACKKLGEIYEKYYSHNDYDVLYSGFFGGGSFEFWLDEKYLFKQVIANDRFYPLYNFWNQLKLDPKKIMSIMTEEFNLHMSKEQFQESREILKNFTQYCCHPTYGGCYSENAVRYFLMNRSSYSGATLSGGWSKGGRQPNECPSCVKNLTNLDLRHFHFRCEDILDIVDNDACWMAKYCPSCISESQGHEGICKTFFFFDPPYHLEKGSKLYGKNGDLHKDFDHDRFYKFADDLHSTFDKCKHQSWMICYNDCEWVREKYKDYHIIPLEWSYGTSSKSSEVVIIPKELVE